MSRQQNSTTTAALISDNCFPQPPRSRARVSSWSVESESIRPPILAPHALVEGDELDVKRDKRIEKNLKDEENEPEEAGRMKDLKPKEKRVEKVQEKRALKMEEMELTGVSGCVGRNGLVETVRNTGEFCVLAMNHISKDSWFFFQSHPHCR